MADTNGHAKTSAKLILDYDLLTGSMTIGGDSPNVNVSLAMLGQATREFEALERLNRLQRAQQAMKEQEDNQRIAAMVRNGR